MKFYNMPKTAETTSNFCFPCSGGLIFMICSEINGQQNTK